MASQDYKFFQCDNELEEQVENFLNKYMIVNKLKGREYLKDMIIYSINYHKNYNTTIDLKELYLIMKKYKGTKTWYVIRRLSDYACNDFFKRNGNKSLAITPKLLIIKAIYEINFKEEFDYYDDKKNKLF